MVSSSLEHKHSSPDVHDESALEATDSASRIQKAAKFWKHASMTSVPAPEKIEYLKAKGFSTEEIHQLWEYLVDEPEETKIEEASLGNVSNEPAGWTPTAISPPHQNFDEESPQQSLALLTVGGMIGLTAAAAVRWLNGGDFTIFPPPSVMGKDHKRTSASTHITQSSTNFASQMKGEAHMVLNEKESRSGEEEEKNTIAPDVALELSQQVREIRCLVQEQAKSQDKILTHFTMQQTKKVTDQSMQLLRQSDAEYDSSDDGTCLVLQEVKALLEQQIAEDASLSSGGHNYVQQALQKIESHQQKQVRETNTCKISPSPPNDDSLIGALNVSHVSSTKEKGRDLDSVEDGAIVDTSTSLKISIQRLATENNSNEPELQSGCQVLYLYVFHLSSNPHVPRYRKIYTSNDSFRKVELLRGGMDLLLAVGFVKKEGFIEWAPENEDVAIECLREASAALTILKSNNIDSIKELGNSTLNKMNNEGAMSDTSPHLQTPQGSSLMSPPNTKKEIFLPTPELFPDTPRQEQQQQERSQVLNGDSENDDNRLSSEERDVSPKRFFFESSPKTADGAFQPVSSKADTSQSNAIESYNLNK